MKDLLREFVIKAVKATGRTIGEELIKMIARKIEHKRSTK